ncbi:hypothetical protein PV10_07113 [Exophiala mesophila]|uniref:Uncharacterized protein n=1 Tax=Exophiala mesophila TaxID=212818 RepID=A0A0D1ZSE1_EXOME|nr:uncharacterized protein PV10_07113 [Exophiala mesophila]KIV89733.1 hypothetical protein PV10_07113 [Exophiala mesophila]
MSSPPPSSNSLASETQDHHTLSLTLAETPAGGASRSSSGTAAMPSSTKPRKFLPQPFEESSRSSQKNNIDHDGDTTMVNGLDPTRPSKSRFSYSDDPTSPGMLNSRPDSTPTQNTAEPVQLPTRPARRKFAAQPIETTFKTSKDRPQPQQIDEPSTPPKARRKFAAQPVETSTRSSKEKKTKDSGDDSETTPKPRRKFAVEPVETSTIRRRRKADSRDSDEDADQTSPHVSSTSSRGGSGPRRFSPELLETAKGSYRRVHLQSPEVQSPPPPKPLSVSSEEEADTVGGLEESRFSAAALARKHPEATRQHSFVVPDLPMIESNTEDESSDAPSLSDTPSSFEVESSRITRADPQESYTEYVLRLAAETVSEKELQEQAMAAYINERPHEPVDHFAISHDEDIDGPLPVPMFQGEKGVDVQTFRRSSAAELDLEMANMRKHHEQLERAKRDLKADTAGQSRFSAAALATRHHLEAKGVKKAKKIRGLDEDSELARMRAAAAPPMLGSDIVFPYTISPKMTRCDPDQAPRPRSQNSDDEASSPVSPHLWSAEKKRGNNAGVGLWMGLCQGTQSQTSSSKDGLRSGIQTPVVEKSNPFEVATPGRGNQTPGRQTPSRKRFFGGLHMVPLTPPRSQDGGDMFTDTIDRKLMLEKQIDDEFSNSVITQIYNYLSLGYPTLARMFDEELSKISRISVEELRKDDANMDAKGYVGAPEGNGADESEVIGKCKRWEALKLYVKEWARQSPNFADDHSRRLGGANAEWGAGARKGSWGH